MISLIWLFVIVVLVGMSIWYFQSNFTSRITNRPSSAASGVRQPTIFTLQLGDIVQYQNTDWVVEDQLTYRDADWKWTEYLLQDGDRLAFLSVDDDDTLEVSLTETVKDCPVSNPPTEQVIYRQQIYQQAESGTATLTRQRKPGIRETCQYYDYTGPGNAILSIEQWASETEVSVGESIRAYQLTFLPGDGKSIHREA
jgi:hypothetical protein